jgi:transcriptional regulator with XRE-family HTH domain
MFKIGSKLRKLRNKNGYSQEYIAHELNMTQGNYCKLEADKFFPSVETVERICKLYSLEQAELLSISGQHDDRDHSSNSPDRHMLVEELISSKDKIIDLQAKQIALLEQRIRELESSVNGMVKKTLTNKRTSVK